MPQAACQSLVFSQYQYQNIETSNKVMIFSSLNNW